MAKVAFLFHLFCGVFSLLVGVGLWFAADRLGTRDQIESFLGDLLGTKNFELAGDKLFRAAIGIAFGLVLLATVGTVLVAFIYNMLSSIFGGVVVSVLQEQLLVPNVDPAMAGTRPTARQRRRNRRNRRRRQAKGRPVTADDGLSQSTSATPDSGVDDDPAGDGVDSRATSPRDEPLREQSPTSAAMSDSQSEADWLSAASDPTGTWMRPGGR